MSIEDLDEDQEKSSVMTRTLEMSNADMSTEMEIVKSRVEQLAGSLELRAGIPHDEVVEKVCTIFRELRGGMTLDGRQKVKPSSGL